MKLFFYRKFIRFVIKHFTIVINNTIQQYCVKLIFNRL